MAKFLEKRNGENIFEYVAPQYRGRDIIDGVIADGMRLRLYNWLRENGNEEDIEGVYNNTSGIREGNEIQLYDNYKFDWDEDRLYISYMYYYNGNVWAVLYDEETKDWYGEFEL